MIRPCLSLPLTRLDHCIRSPTSPQRGAGEPRDATALFAINVVQTGTRTNFAALGGIVRFLQPHILDVMPAPVLRNACRLSRL